MADLSKTERGTADRGLGGTVKFVPPRQRGPQGVVIHGAKAWELEQDVPIVGKVKKDAKRRTPQTDKLPPRAPVSQRPVPAVPVSPSTQVKPSGPSLTIKSQPLLQIPWQAQPPLEIPWQADNDERGLGTNSRLADRRGVEAEKPSAKEYFKGHEPPVDTLAQVGGLIRALLYLNPALYGSEEQVRKTEEVADDLLPFEYPPQELAQAKQYEQIWTAFFSEALNMWQAAEPAADISLVARRAAANIASAEAAAAATRAIRGRPTLEIPILDRIPAGLPEMPDISITFRESVVISEDILEANPILQDLAQARRSRDFEAVWDIWRRFRNETGMQMQVLRPNQLSVSNPMRLQPGILQVREGLYSNPAEFARELQHELNAYYSSQYFRDAGLGRSDLLWTPRTEGPPGISHQNHVLDLLTN